MDLRSTYWWDLTLESSLALSSPLIISLIIQSSKISGESKRLTCVGQCDQTILDTLLTSSKWMQKPDCHNSLMVAEIGISVKIPACWWQHGKINTSSTTCLLPTPLMRRNRRASPNDRGMAQRQNPCPPTVAAYAQYMNRVDKPDHMTMQNKSKKCMKWYRRVDTKLMKTSLSSYCGCLCPVYEWSRQNRPHDNAKQIKKTHEMVQKSGHQIHRNQSV